MIGFFGWVAGLLVVTSFFPCSLGLVKLIVSSYPAALVPPFVRRVGDALCSLSPALVERHWSPPARHGFCALMHPIRQWADTFPWAALVSAIEQSFDTRFPKKSPRGRRPVPIRVLFALELLKHELGASDEDICHRLRTDFAVMYACGLREYQVNPSQAHFVLPETLCEFRGRIDEPSWMSSSPSKPPPPWTRGLVSPAHLVIDTFPSEQGSQRVTDATTLYKAQKKRSRSSTTSSQQCRRRTTNSSAKPETSRRTSQRSCVALAEAVAAKGMSS